MVLPIRAWLGFFVVSMACAQASPARLAEPSQPSSPAASAIPSVTPRETPDASDTRLPSPSPPSPAAVSASTALAAPAAMPSETPPPDRKTLLTRELAEAKAGRASTLRMRVWRCGASCTCPSPCLQITAEDLPTTWVVVLDAQGRGLSLADWQSADLTGKFTGKTQTRKGPSPDAYELPEFRLSEPAKKRGTSMAPEFEGAPFELLRSPSP